MYGTYRYPCAIEEESVSIEVTEEDGLFMYRRICGDDTRELVISPKDGELIINPVEPVNLPKNITRFLEIEFDKIVMSPESEDTYYLTFPVEIGVFLKSGKSVSLIDVFSQNAGKYSLYGSPKEGVVVRWHKSMVYRKMPEIDNLREGVMSLKIINPEKEIIELSRGVFDSYGMKIFYNDWYVTMSAEIRVLPKDEAETRFFNAPIVAGTDKTIELYYGREILAVGKFYKMGWGYQ
jgi:hypothetical protein